MLTVCPRCSRSLPEMDVPPAFCPFCGQRLADPAVTPSGPSHLDTTAAFTPTQTTPPGEAEEIVPESIGGYRLGRLLGKGGMGQVFEALSLNTEELVAVKLLSSKLSSSPVSLERFRQEGRLASQISHPRCVFVYAADTDQGRPYIVMERMPGETLKDLVDRKGPLSQQDAIRYILDVIDGLREAHRMGFIHRDVKPSNCFLTKDGQIKVGDFGLSRSLSSGGDLTQTGTFLGTVLYASPEQIRGETIDFASDVYSVSATLFHLLTGRAPFHQDNLTAALAQIISEDAPNVRQFRPELTRTLAGIVAKGLERERDRRYRNLDEMREALVALIPSQLTASGLGIRVGAYFIDEIVLHLAVLIPSYIIYAQSKVTNVLLDLGVFLAYFTILEGWYGASVGKRALGLRVCKVGSTEPPGLRAGLFRTLAFAVLVGIRFWDEAFVGQSDMDPRVVGLFSLLWFVVGLPLLLLPMRSSRDYRGLHERLSGTCVRKLPNRGRPIVLESCKENRLRLLPPLTPDSAIAVKPYVIDRGSEGPEPGEWLFVGQDTVLARAVLIHLQPDEREPSPERRSLGRTTRLRLLNSGIVAFRGKPYTWNAYLAPVGAPIEDIAHPERRLRWHEARLILEQLVEELHSAKRDGTLPSHLCLDQVWVQNDGRLQLLDFPLPRGAAGERPPSVEPIHLIRQTIQHTLEGTVKPNGDGKSIRAPIPGHARRIIDTSLHDSREQSLAKLQERLAETRELPHRVEVPQRVFHIGLQTGFLAVGLFIMFLCAGLFTVFLVVSRQAVIERCNHLLAGMNVPAKMAGAVKDRETGPIIADPAFRKEVRQLAERSEAELEKYRKGLTWLERKIADAAETKPDERLGFRDEVKAVSELLAKERRGREGGADALPNEKYWKAVVGIILVWPMLWGLCAFLSRGGVSTHLGRVRLVKVDGGPASRLLCLGRTLMVWLPVGFLLALCVWLQANASSYSTLHAVVWWTAVGVVLAYVVHALSNPEQTWLDRKLEVLLIPR